jgi:hypothetical protein
MLQPVAPIDTEVAQHDHLDGLQPPRLTLHRRAKAAGDVLVEHGRTEVQHPEDQAVEDQILPEQEREVDVPMRPQEALSRPRGEGGFEGPEQNGEEHDARPRRETESREVGEVVVHRSTPCGA